VKGLWIVDPKSTTVKVYRLQKDDDTPEATYDAASEFASPLLPGLTVRAADVFKR
jgi:Uma2 family endonuclease